MIAIALWIQKVKTTMDALWGVTCLFCVPGVVVTAVGLMIPHGAHGGVGLGQKIYSFEVSDLIEKAPRSYSPEAGTGGFFAYRLGLFDRQGKLVHEYPDQLVEPNLDAQRGSIVIEIPNDVPSGEYSLKVFKSSGYTVREVPLNVGE